MPVEKNLPEPVWTIMWIEGWLSAHWRAESIEDRRVGCSELPDWGRAYVMIAICPFEMSCSSTYLYDGGSMVSWGQSVMSPESSKRKIPRCRKI